MRKDPIVLAPRPHKRSWAALGVDTSMSSIALAAQGYDATLDRMVGPTNTVLRWTPEHDYFRRLLDSARAEQLVLDVLAPMFVKNDQVYIAIEEPWYYGAVKMSQSAYLKQQAEIAGCVKGALLRCGWRNLHEVNNQSWAGAVRREMGVHGKEWGKKEKMKWLTKEWAMKAFGLPDWPDLVKGKEGGKIPRPESGYGAKAQAEQPDDRYDAFGILAWMTNEMGE